MKKLLFIIGILLTGCVTVQPYILGEVVTSENFDPERMSDFSRTVIVDESPYIQLLPWGDSVDTYFKLAPPVNAEEAVKQLQLVENQKQCSCKCHEINTNN